MVRDKRKVTLKSVATGKLKFSTDFMQVVIRTKTSVTEREKLNFRSNYFHKSACP